MKPSLPFMVDARTARRLFTFNRTSALAGRLADLRLPKPLLMAAIRAYAGYYKVNLGEAERSMDQFDSFGEFFARALKPGVRTVTRTQNGLASPCDGALHNFGTVRNGQLPQVKGHTYSLAELLGDAEAAAPFEGGTYATVYLSPSDYHRVHTPVAGKITQCRYLPGALYSVSPFVVQNLSNLFVTNERIAIHFETDLGRVAVVMVAATIVGRVTLTFSDLCTNCNGRGEAVERFATPIAMARGQELGAFRLGSTVVLLLEGTWEPNMLVNEMPVRMGGELFRKNLV